MPNPLLRKTVSTPGLLREVRARFNRIEDTVAGRALFLHWVLPDGETLYRTLVFGHRSELVLYDTS